MRKKMEGKKIRDNEQHREGRMIEKERRKR